MAHPEYHPTLFATLLLVDDASSSFSALISSFFELHPASLNLTTAKTLWEKKGSVGEECRWARTFVISLLRLTPFVVRVVCASRTAAPL